MPKKNKNYYNRRSSSNNTRWIILIVAAVVIAAVAIIALAVKPLSPTAGVSFPAREMGSASAPVKVEEFADFQCPYCALFHTTAEQQLKAQYIQTGKVHFIFNNFPVVDSQGGGNESHLAALAALCAGDQGAFWDYHDYLFQNLGPENSGALSTPRLESIAAQLNLNSATFGQCLSNQSHLDVLDADIQRGNSLGLNGTPSFFVNGRAVSVSQDFHELFTAIDNALGS